MDKCYLRSRIACNQPSKNGTPARTEGCGRISKPEIRSSKFETNLSRHRLRLGKPVIPLLLQFERELFVAGARDAAIDQHMHKIRHNIIEQPLIMRDHQLGI